MREQDRVVQALRPDDTINWCRIKNPDVFSVVSTPQKIPAPPKTCSWRCPKPHCNKQYASRTQLHRHLFSQISHKATVENPEASSCYIQLPSDETQARAEVERIGTLPPPTRRCPFGTKTCHSDPSTKCPTCIMCQNMKQQLSEWAKASYPRVNAHARMLRKRK